MVFSMESLFNNLPFENVHYKRFELFVKENDSFESFMEDITLEDCQCETDETTECLCEKLKITREFTSEELHTLKMLFDKLH